MPAKKTTAKKTTAKATAPKVAPETTEATEEINVSEEVQEALDIQNVPPAAPEAAQEEPQGLEAMLSALPPEVQEYVSGLEAVKAKATQDGSHIDVPEDYEPKPGDELAVHVLIEKPTIKGGKRYSRPYIQQYNPRAFDTFLRHYHMQGYVIHEVLFYPEGYRGVRYDPAVKMMPRAMEQRKR